MVAWSFRFNNQSCRKIRVPIKGAISGTKKTWCCDGLGSKLPTRQKSKISLLRMQEFAAISTVTHNGTPLNGGIPHETHLLLVGINYTRSFGQLQGYRVLAIQTRAPPFPSLPLSCVVGIACVKQPLRAINKHGDAIHSLQGVQAEASLRRQDRGL